MSQARSSSVDASRIERTRYDGLAMTLHRVTVALVLTQFLLAEFSDYAARPTRQVMVTAHMSFGIILTGVVLVRIFWRLLPGHRVQDASRGWDNVVAKATHYSLYALLAAQAVLGFLLRWSGSEAMSFFGVPIPPVMAPTSKPVHHLFGDLHNWIGWTIILLAAAHGVAALVHHFMLKDGMLWRILPGRRARA
jgi:cytochrome b561